MTRKGGRTSEWALHPVLSCDPGRRNTWAPTTGPVVWSGWPIEQEGTCQRNLSAVAHSMHIQVDLMWAADIFIKPAGVTCMASALAVTSPQGLP